MSRSQRTHYEPVGAPFSMRIPHRDLDPYIYNQRVHRTGDNALNSRMSVDIPPCWGPEHEATYPMEQWEKDVHAWIMTTRTTDERKGPLLMTQLTGVAKAYMEAWISKSDSRSRRDRRIKKAIEHIDGL